MKVKLRLALANPDQAHTRVFDIEAPAGTQFTTLREHLGPALVGKRLRVDDIDIDDGFRLGEPPLVDGASLEPQRTTITNSVPTPLRLVVSAGPGQGRSCPLPPGEHILGRAHPLLTDDPLVSRTHARVIVRRGSVEVCDEGSSNGTSLDARALDPGEPCVWRIGQHLRLGGTRIRLDTTLEPVAVEARGDGTLRIPAPVANRLELAPTRLEWPSRPTAPPRSPLRWVAALASVPVALVMAVVLHSTLMLAFMLIGPLTIGLTYLDDRRRGRLGGRAAAREYARSKADTGRRIDDLLNRERLERTARLPPPDVLTDVAAGRRPGIASGERSWPLVLRLGHGTSPSIHSVTHDGVTRHLTLDDAPVAVALTSGDLLHLDCDAASVGACMEHVVARLLVEGVPGACGLHVVTDMAEGARWTWCRDTARLEVGAALPEDTEQDLAERAARPGHTGDELPVFVLDARSEGAREALRRWLPVASGVLVWVGPSAPGMQRERRGSSGPADLVVTVRHGHNASLLPTGHRFTFDEPISSWFVTTTRLARRWATTSRRGTSSSIPTTVPADSLLPADVARAWAAGPSTAVPVGFGATGPVHLDLVRSGPHALVAGTTGAGKSEFLLAYLRGLFTLNGPGDVTALLIDYKGGATFGPLVDAPQVVGLVTDLDNALAERALSALQAEIKRREHTLAAAGYNSYTAYRATPPNSATALPRLFVIVDEFRVLAEELPEFVAGLVRLAAVGRSLGMHLVLATQRPGGAVTADMRANLDVRVALRVRERSDSIDVIDSPAAAAISPRHPGRAFLAHGGSTPVELQTAFTGAPRMLHTDEPPLHVHEVDLRAPGPLAAEPECPGCRPAGHSTTNDLETFVAEAKAAATHLPAPRRPVLPPLCENTRPVAHLAMGEVRWPDLLLARPQAGERPRNSVPIAVVDLPHDQSQPVLSGAGTEHIGIAGAPRSGRTHAAMTIASARRSTGERTWWVGDVPSFPVDDHFAADDPDDVVRLLTALNEPSPVAERVAIVVDGWEALNDSLMRINHGLAADEMLRHVQRAHQFRRVFVITGARLVLASKLAALLEVKIVLRQNDQTEYSLAGLRPAQVPAAMPPGRGLVLPHAHVLHFVSPGEPGECDTLSP